MDYAEEALAEHITKTKIEELKKERNQLKKKLLSDKYKDYKDEDFKKDAEFRATVKRMNSVTKELREQNEIMHFGRVLTEEEREEYYIDMGKKASKMGEEYARMEELIAKQEQREAEMKQPYTDYINSLEEADAIEEKIFPKKQITVRIFPNTHKKLKTIATSEGTTLEKAATSIVENEIYDMDIVKYVADEIKTAEEMEEFSGGALYGDPYYFQLSKEDGDKHTYDMNDKVLKKGNPRKRINVKVYQKTHLKLKIMAAIQDRSLNDLVSSIIEDEIGEENNIDSLKLMDEILEYKEDKE